MIEERDYIKKLKSIEKINDKIINEALDFLIWKEKHYNGELIKFD